MDDHVALPQGGLGSPRPGSAPVSGIVMAQWLAALLCLGGDRMQDLRSAAIPNPHMKHKADSSWVGPRLGIRGPPPPLQVLVAAQDRKRGLVFHPRQSEGGN